MNSILNVAKVVSVITGTVIGAGFASGKEIYIFFAQYGKSGLLGTLISSVLTGIIIYATLYITKQKEAMNNNEFLDKITENKKLKWILESVINTFLLVSFWIMCAGFCTFFKQEFNIPIIVTAIINAIVVYFLLMKNIDGIIKLNLIVVPIMIAIIIIISLKNCSFVNIINANINTSSNNMGKAVVNAILYASYNSITLIPIIVLLGKSIKSKKETIAVTIASTIIFLVLILAIYQLLVFSAINISNIEIPVLTILNDFHPAEKISYSIAIITAILTSAISSGYGSVENISDKRKYKLAVLGICIMEIPIAYIGFGRLVEKLYPLFGVVGMVQIITIVKKAKSIAKNSKNWYKLYKKNLHFGGKF